VTLKSKLRVTEGRYDLPLVKLFDVE